MANFQEMLKQQQEMINNKSGGFTNDTPVEYPSSKLKNEELRFDKETDQLVVRILPPKNTGEYFAKKFKEVFLTVYSKNDKAMNLNAIIGTEDTPETSNLLANYNTWLQQKRVPNRFNKETKLSTRYFVNAVQIVQGSDGQPTMERDMNGEIMVRLLKLPSSAHDQLVAKMLDPYLQPSGETEYGIIGTNNAYALSIRKPPKGSGQMTYSVDVYQKDLGPLPNNWRDLLEDLEYQATPSEKYNAKYVNSVIAVANGLDPNANSGNSAGGNAPQVEPPKQQQPYQQPYQPAQQANNEPQWDGKQANPPAQPQDNSNNFMEQLPQQNYQGDVGDNMPTGMADRNTDQQQTQQPYQPQPPVNNEPTPPQGNVQQNTNTNNSPSGQPTPPPQTNSAGAPDIASFLQQMSQQQQ